MKAVIIAAGKGKRMGPLTENRPKAMLPVANKPIIYHIIANLNQAGIRDFIIVTGYCKEKITEYFENNFLNVNIEFIEQREQKGTANAIAVVRGYIDERFLVINGDVIANSKDIKKLISAQGEVVIAVKEVKKPEEYGILYVKGKKVEKLVEKPEKPTSNLANAGIYVFEPSIFHAISNTSLSPRGEYEITDSIQLMINSGKEVSYTTIEAQDIGFPWHLLEANETILQQKKEWEILGEVEAYATLKGKVEIGKDTIIRNGAYIIGPVIIGENCDIGPNCFIRPATSIGNSVRIGNAVEVKNSIVMSETNIGHLSYVGDSIIGEKCNLGAGTKVANLRHDGREVMCKIKGKRYHSGRRKLGVIMGDKVKTGINSMLNVGVTIVSGTHINPGEFIK